MKRNLLTAILGMFIIVSAWGQQEITFKWKGKVGNPYRWFSVKYTGTSYAVNWGDDTYDEKGTLHKYATEGEYTVTLKGSDGCEFTELDIEGGASNLTISGVRYDFYHDIVDVDISKAPTLQILTCSENSITSIDLSKNTSLKSLTCQWNKLTTLDVSKCASLETLKCGSNLMESITLNNPKLTTLDCGSNNLTTIDLSKSTALQEVDCNGNKLTTIDLSEANALKVVDCGNNQLTTLGINSSTLTELNCVGNLLKTLDLTNLPSLDRLNCSYNELTSLDISKNPEFVFLQCNSNQLTELDTSGNPKLAYLYCENNRITSLKLSDAENYCDIVACYNNALQLSDLYSIPQKECRAHILGTQTLATQTIKPGASIDLSDQVSFGGQPTEFAVQKGENEAVKDVDYTLSNGVITFLSEGNFTVSLTNQGIDSNDRPAKMVVPVKVTNESGINDATVKTITISPNPATDQIVISGLQPDEILWFYNATGLPMFSYQASGETEIISISHLPTGMYFVKTSDAQVLKWLKK